MRNTVGGEGNKEGECSPLLFFFQAEDGIRDYKVTGVQTCALPISGVAWFAAMLSVGSTAIGSEAADKPLQITVQIGYHNTVKLGQWMPVVVDLTNADRKSVV